MIEPECMRERRERDGRLRQKNMDTTQKAASIYSITID